MNMYNTHTRPLRIMAPLAAAVLVAIAGALTGCGGLGSATATLPTAPVTSVSPTLHGRVHGGQQPIAGATVQLYAVGTTGLKSASTPLLNPAASTDANGNFNITGQYACPQQGSLVYMTSMGGNPGLQSGTNNAAASLLAVLGACNTAVTDTSGATHYTLDPSLFIFLNEVTTVGGVYALAPFMKDYADIGAASNSLGLANAFNTAAMLVNISLGTTPGTISSPNATNITYDPNTGFPVVINTLADILASCINSDGTGSACQLLFSTTNVNGTPNNTIAAVFAIATNPGLSPTTLRTLATPSAPFQPVLASPPNDWTVTLHYTGGTLSTPNGIAFDSAGNLWVANQTSNYVTKVYTGNNGVNPAGSQVQYSGGGILGPQALAIDQSNNVWIANTAGSSIVKLDNSGNVLSGAGYTAGGINAPVAIALDSAGNAWVANFNGNSITQMLTTGSASSFSPITQGTYAVSMPRGIAIDSNNQVWVSNSGLSETSGLAAQVLRFDQNGNPQSSIYQTLQGTAGMAIDLHDNVWIAGNGNATVGTFNHNGAFGIVGGKTIGGGLSQSSGIAVDGADTIWVTNSGAAGSLTALGAGTGTALSPSSGFGSLNAPLGVAIDPSGNVWTANSGDNSLTEFIGIAAPTLTPLVKGVATAVAQLKHLQQSSR